LRLVLQGQRDIVLEKSRNPSEDFIFFSSQKATIGGESNEVKHDTSNSWKERAFGANQLVELDLQSCGSQESIQLPETDDQE
jgi:hypothetical protein